MEIKEVEEFNMIGIAIRTTNEGGQSATDIRELWNKFLSNNLLAQIPNRADDTIYSIYMDYEKDYTKPYTTILGCRVKSMDTIPDGFTSRTFSGGKYVTFTAKGNMADGIVFQAWSKIWNTDIDRAYTADFEVYGAKAKDPANAEIDIFVSVLG